MGRRCSSIGTCSVILGGFHSNFHRSVIAAETAHLYHHQRPCRGHIGHFKGKSAVRKSNNTIPLVHLNSVSSPSTPYQTVRETVPPRRARDQLGLSSMLSGSPQHPVGARCGYIDVALGNGPRRYTPLGRCAGSGVERRTARYRACRPGECQIIVA